MSLPYRLDDLIAAVSAATDTDDPLADVARAVETAEQLGELADHLVGHFVDEARKAGASWADIGGHMGVTRQAAQKRFVPPKAEEPQPVPSSSFDRFSDAARDAAAAAISYARRGQRDRVGGEDLFLGLLDQLDSVAEQAFEAFEVPLEQVREAAIKAFGQPQSPLDAVASDVARESDVAQESGADTDAVPESDLAPESDVDPDEAAGAESDVAPDSDVAPESDAPSDEAPDVDTDESHDGEVDQDTAGEEETSAASRRDEIWEAFERADRTRRRQPSTSRTSDDHASGEETSQGRASRDEVPPFPFGRDAARFLQMALREALRAGSGSVGTEHLLRGLLRDDTSPAWALLRSMGITRTQAEQWLRDQER